MSVINKMLRDLDSRNAPDAKLAASDADAPAITLGTFSVDEGRSGRRLSAWGWPLAMAALVLAAIVGWKLHFGFQSVAMQRAESLVGAPNTSATASPPLVAGALPARASVPNASAPLATQAIASTQPASAGRPQTFVEPPVAPAVHIAAVVPPRSDTLESGREKEKEMPSPVRASVTQVEQIKSVPAKVEPVASSAKATTGVNATPPAVASASVAKPVTKEIPTTVNAANKPLANEVLAQAQVLWQGGAREPATELLREAVANAEHAATLPENVPGFASLVRELAHREIAQGRVSQAMALLVRLEPVLGTQADLWALRGNVAQRLGRHTESVSAYQRALSLRPEEPRWMLGAAVSMAALGQLQSAGELADRARQAGVVSADVLNYLKQLGVVLPVR